MAMHSTECQFSITIHVLDVVHIHTVLSLQCELSNQTACIKLNAENIYHCNATVNCFIAFSSTSAFFF